MTFQSPARLVLLLVIPLVVAGYVASRRRGARRAANLAAEGLAVADVGRRLGWRRHLPFALTALALAALAVGMARPAATVKTPRRQGTVVLAVDVSNSMGATDVKPSRLEAAKSAARAFVNKQPAGVRIAVVAFGDGAVPVQAFTTSHSDLVKAIDRLSVGGGTSMGKALLTSLDTIAGKTLTIDPQALASDSGQVDVGYYGGAVIVLLSDGEETSQPDPVAMAGVASVAGVHIHAIGVGTTQGTTIQVGGFSVATALDSDLLQKVAGVTNGTYHAASDATGLASVARGIDLRFKIVAQHIEITALFAIAAALLLVAGGLLSILWFGRVV
jgi:Ca-activated chloride channel homolog